MTIGLWDSFVGPPGNFGPYNGNYELGLGFETADDGVVSSLRWWAPNTTTTNKPTHLHLWDGVSGALLAVVDPPNTNGLIGWQTYSLPTPIELSASHRYVVSCTFGTYGTTLAYSGSAPSPPTGLSMAATKPIVWAGDGTSNVYPNTTYTSAILVDVVFSTGEEIPPDPADPMTNSDFVYQASRIFDPEDPAFRSDWLPATTKDAVDAAAADAADAAANTATIASLTAGAVTWLNDRTSQLTDFLNGVNSGAVGALNNLASRITGTTAAGGSAFLAPSGTLIGQVADDTQALVELLVALKRNALVDFPSSPWVQTASTTFDTSLAWTEPADLYVVSFSSLGSNVINTVAAGVDVSYRLAWWCPLIGAFGQQRRFLDFPDCHLWLDGQRMPGLLLHSPQGATGSVQAWTYS